MGNKETVVEGLNKSNDKNDVLVTLHILSEETINDSDLILTGQTFLTPH
jgi:hypothetical protein